MLGLQYSSTSQKLYFMANAMYCKIMKAKAYQFQVVLLSQAFISSFSAAHGLWGLFLSSLHISITTDQVNLAFIYTICCI